jgi:hypothetical protein
MKPKKQPKPVAATDLVVCKRCEQTLPAYCFGAHGFSPDGIRQPCRECQRRMVEQRSTLRWNYPNEVVYSTEREEADGHLVDVSEGGVFVRAVRLPATGERIQLLVRGFYPVLILKGEVRWAGKKGDVEGFGVQLEDPPQDYLNLVRSLASASLGRDS